ncbi:uncharacterized protein BN467_00977 [Prevotella sp. CAG:1124]|nr:uncharacterized protein BN467_00977 [Prevotella sp. CAG:1124]
MNTQTRHNRLIRHATGTITYYRQRKKKMKNNIITCAVYALTIIGLSACSQEDKPEIPTDAKSTPMTFAVTHPAQRTRVTDTDFENGDKIGLFVAKTDAPLEIGGNLVNNEALTCNNGNWTAGRTIYWDEGTYNAYAYYPYISPVTSIDDMPFSVNTDQQSASGIDGLDGYEASDFLYAKADGLSASSTPVSLTFRHIMSKITIRLIKGEDFEGEMPTNAKVYIHSTVPTATIDLEAGVATRYSRGTRTTIEAKQDADYMFSAIVVPQRVENRMPLIEVIMKGVSYMYESTFNFKPGTEHLVNFVISDNPDQVKIDIGGEIQDWQ